MGTYPIMNKISTKMMTTTTTQHHPDLENLYFIDRMTKERINPNGEPVHIDNELFTGKLLIMVRTSDADDNTTSNIHNSIEGGSVMNDKVSKYLRRDKKRFEVQMQIKLKKLPKSQRIYLSCGFDESVKLGLLQRTSLKAALRFCKMKNPSFSYSLVGKENVSEFEQKLGKYEKPFFAFPIDTTLHRIVITKPGEELPILGQDVHEDAEVLKKRLKGLEPIVYNTEDTYTLCLWNDQVDFVSWKAMNLPAVPKFSLTHVNDGQPMNVKIYSLMERNDEKHLQCNIETLLDLEVTHLGVTSLGSGAKEWLQRWDNTAIGGTISLSQQKQDEDRKIECILEDRSIYSLLESI